MYVPVLDTVTLLVVLLKRLTDDDDDVQLTPQFVDTYTVLPDTTTTTTEPVDEVDTTADVTAVLDDDKTTVLYDDVDVPQLEDAYTTTVYVPLDALYTTVVVYTY